MASPLSRRRSTRIAQLGYSPSIFEYSDFSDQNCEFEEEESFSFEADEEVQGGAPAGRRKKGGLTAGDETEVLAARGSRKRRGGRKEANEAELYGKGELMKRGRRSTETERHTEGEAFSLDRSGVNGPDVSGDKKKGKEKVDEEGDGELKPVTEQDAAEVCGICLSEDGDVERGKLDCCDHFFCYGCIMEWAKVESRCPMCKQRFVTIVRPPIAGSRPRRTIRIPTRNQVYIPPEDENSGFGDPYADIVCMECQEVGEERLLLLCDQCDAAAHTYCVGLGRSVPRGDWFCRSCQPLPEGSGEDDNEDFVLGFSDDDDEAAQIRSIVATVMTGTGSRRVARRTAAVRSSSLSNRVRRPRSGVRRRLWRRLTHRRNVRFSGPRISRSLRGRQNSESTWSFSSQPLDRQAGPARTVPGQRRLQERIQTMRENWEGFQGGNLQFPSEGCNPVSSVQQVNAAIEKVTPPSSQPQSRAEIKLVEPSVAHGRELSGILRNTNNSTTRVGDNHGNEEPVVAQAWLMLEQARTLCRVSGPTVGSQKTVALLPGPSARKEHVDTRPYAEPTTKEIMVLNRTGHGSISSSSTKFLHENQLKQNYLKESFMKKKDESSFRKEYPTASYSEEGTVASSSTFLQNVAVSNKECCKQEVHAPGCDHIANKADVEGTSGYSIEANERVFFLSNASSSGSKIKTAGVVNPIKESNSTRGSPSRKVYKECCKHMPLMSSSGQESNRMEIHHVCFEQSKRKEVAGASSQDSEMICRSPSSLGKFESTNRDGPAVSIMTLKTGNSQTGNAAQVEQVSWISDHMNTDEEKRLSISTSHQQQIVNKASSSLNSSKPLALLVERGNFEVMKGSRPGKAESVKDQVANMVKTELWPLYLSQGIGKDQFKEIARSATHALLAHCGLEQRKISFPIVVDLSCCHALLSGQSLIAGCCNNCFKLQVNKVVRTITDKTLGLTT